MQNGTYLKRPKGKTLYGLTGERRIRNFGFRRIEQYVAMAYTLDGVLIGERTLSPKDVRKMDRVEVKTMPRSTRGGGRRIKPDYLAFGAQSVKPGKTKEGGVSALKQVETSEKLKELDDQFTTIRSSLVTQRNKLIASYRENPNPQAMVGFIKDFRFRMGDVNESPRFTFKLDTRLGMVLWISCSTEIMMPIMREMPDSKESIAKQFNGKMLKVIANGSGILIPSQMLEHFSGATDYYGAPLYRDARVIRYEDGQPGVVVRQGSNDPSVVWVNFDNFDDPETAFSSDGLIRL